ncbi:hypothetical protein C900_04829 [Fulvivirga imtechensis AK7]|uniref:DUF5615 domain-containing protein n=1 Tax=Fulvivirga imtechensis AK7 TaxID=1237149 RepID=L8JQ29_9BACT|nr:hypothetical protein C900_04829 [Fulvivirga imtechensis AK7]
MILADENIDTQMVAILREKGIEVQHIKEGKESFRHKKSP